MRLGVTGNIASGKSTVARLLQDKGALLVDADTEAHLLYAEDPSLVRALSEAFGAEVRHGDGTLNRARLGELVFGDAEKLRRLNALVHPSLVRRLEARLEALEDPGQADSEPGPRFLVVLDAALIVELSFQDRLDKLLCVCAPEPLRLRRLLERNRLSEAEALSRIRSQMPEEEKARLADFIVRNEGTEEELRRQVDGVWKALRAGRGFKLRKSDSK